MTAPLEAALHDAGLALSRRTLLKLGGVALVTGIVPAGCASGQSAWLTPPTDARLAVLSPRAFATFTAACARIAGPTTADAIERGALVPGVVADAWLARTPALGDPLGAALTLLEFAPFPLLPKWRPFTALAAEAQDAVLLDLRDSRLATKRAVFGGVRALSLLAVYLSPGPRAAIGFPGPFGTETISIGDAMAPLPPQPTAGSVPRG